MANYYCLLLDSDDTILDFSTAQRRTVQQTLEHFQFPCDEAAQSLFLGIEAEIWEEFNQGKIKKEKLLTERFIRFFRQIGQEGNAREMNEYYLAVLAHHPEPVPGADVFLKSVSEVASLAVLTNGLEGVQIPRIRMSGLGRYLDDVLISEKVGLAKPNPKLFELALKRLGVENKSKVLVIGDSLSADIQGGINAGLDTCWINPADQPNTTGIQPTYTVRSLEEILPVVMEPDELEALKDPNKKHQNDLI